VSLLWILFLRLGDKIGSSLVRKVVSAVLVFAIYATINEVEDIFKSKNSYFPNFWPPAHYKKGPLRLDQGHTV